MQDTVFQLKIQELYFSNKPKKKRGREWRQYYKMVYNFKKVYPYALIAKSKIMEADHYLNTHKMTLNQRERYIKNFEKELFRQFEKPLRNLTISQGRLLLKLVDREVGQSSYYLIKSYKGGFTAFFWQGIAKLFGSDLKEPYDKFGKDRAIEELVMIYQSGNFDALYYSIFRE